MDRVTLPWPPKELSPNTRVHWAVKARVAKQYRKACGWLAQQLKKPGSLPISVTIHFYPPDKRHYDEDNLVARMKSGLDGISDAIGVNDRDFRISPVMETVFKNGRIEIELRELERRMV